MHSVVLTLVVLGIGPGDSVPPRVDSGHAVHAGCEQCAAGASHHDIHRALKAQHNMMPQSCYDPSYGCYRDSRFMNRYPAFHGSYYRRPYNYRQLYEYPWRAQPHEPGAFFSSVVETQAGDAEPPTPPRSVLPGRTEFRPTPASTLPLDQLDQTPIGSGIGDASAPDAPANRNVHGNLPARTLEPTSPAEPRSTSRSAARIRAVSIPRMRR